MDPTIEELSQEVARLAELNRDLMGLIENSYDALTIMDGEGRHLLVSPACERVEDIPFLLVHYLTIYNKKYGRKVRLSKDSVDKLCTYRWPGNVRELANLIEYLVVATDREVILPEHLPGRKKEGMD